MVAAFWIADFYISLGILSYTAVFALVFLLLQVFYNQKIVGLTYGVLLTMLSVYKLVEAVVVYTETANASGGSLRLLMIKCTLFGIALLMAVVYLWYYVESIRKQNTTTTSV